MPLSEASTLSRLGMTELFYLSVTCFVLWFLTSSYLLYRVWNHKPQWAEKNRLPRSLAEREKNFKWLCMSALLNRELREFGGLWAYANFLFFWTSIIGFVVNFALIVHKYPVKDRLLP
jgi:hypothetical protein